MPQLDRVIIFSQIFWLFVVFFLLYIVLTHFFLPSFLKSLKSRKKIIEENNSEILTLKINSDKKQILIKQIILRNLVLVENVILNNFKFNTILQDNLSSKLVDEKIGTASLDIALYCDKELLKCISFYPKSLNLQSR